MAWKSTAQRLVAFIHNLWNRSSVADPSASFPAQRFSFEDFAEDEENSVIV
jgi:hypothetical protein